MSDSRILSAAACTNCPIPCVTNGATNAAFGGSASATFFSRSEPSVSRIWIRSASASWMSASCASGADGVDVLVRVQERVVGPDGEQRDGREDAHEDDEHAARDASPTGHLLRRCRWSLPVSPLRSWRASWHFWRFGAAIRPCPADRGATPSRAAVRFDGPAATAGEVALSAPSASSKIRTGSEHRDDRVVVVLELLDREIVARARLRACPT